MIRTLLASTAIAAVMSTAAFAQDTTTTAPAATPEATMSTTTNTNASAETAVMADGMLASDVIGAAVYNSSADDAENIGDVNDIVLADDGSVESVVIGVGGFLGLGEKRVAVPFDQLSWVNKNNDRWLVVEATREQLEAQPAFDVSAYRPQPAANDTAAMDPAANPANPDANTMTAAPADTAASTTTAPADTATAPADTAASTATAPADTAATDTAANDTAATTQDTMSTSSIDRSALVVVTNDKLSADNLIGRTVYGANDENIGEISDVLLADGKVDGFVIDVGGFLGMGEKPVAVSSDNLDVMADANGDVTVFTPFTEEQLKNQPEYSEEAYKSNPDSVILIAPAG
ncbi:PRC-barrel domain protein [Hoeflea marina]|uniref:PRC-barrel domain protein n=1 Tax=Hoeflea marina TaxID=274592 RepID=A0A317PMP6_9HYPH|nr:PRC-barrel domain-containing protein [Hoeflea marina]PWW02026.1 PRC-barrel domain protein [Hoeflea marina]